MITASDTLTNESLISSNFDEPILYSPARIENKELTCNSLKIITAFTDCERISTHAIALSDGLKSHLFAKDINIDIILGMTKSSLSEKKHKDICRLLHYINSTRSMPHISCRYISSGTEVHSKIYIWGYPDSNQDFDLFPSRAYCGSLNYTMNAFYKRRETVTYCNPFSALNYYQSLLPDTIDCFDPDAVKRIKKVSNNNQPEEYDLPDNSESDYLTYDLKKPVDTLNVSLLKADGSEAGFGSGVNWGIRPNGTKRNPDQAYIPYNANNRKPGFFPDRIDSSDKNCPVFRVITKDFGSFHMRLAQENNKAIHSVESNAILGEWLRKKLNVPSGGFITKALLERYGKTYVTFRKYEDGTYLLDF